MVIMNNDLQPNGIQLASNMKLLEHEFFRKKKKVKCRRAKQDINNA